VATAQLGGEKGVRRGEDELKERARISEAEEKNRFAKFA